VKARDVVAAALVATVGVCWGLLAPASKALFAAAPASFDGVSVAVARAVWGLPVFALAALVLALRERPRLDLRRWLAIGGAGLVFGLGITLTFSLAAMHTSIAHISFLIGTSPVTNSIAAALAFRLPIGRRERLALALGIVGVALLAASHTGGSASLLGDGLMLLWLAGFAVYAVLLRFVGGAVSSTFTMSAVGVVALASVILAALALPGSFRGAGHVLDSPSTAGWFFGEILIGSTFVGQTLYAVAVRRFGVSIATIGAEYTALAVGIVTSVLWHETWSVLTIVAGLLLMGALATTFVPLPGLKRVVLRADEPKAQQRTS
jgi:drug/metabolite transporter (DMT)-like permease